MAYGHHKYTIHVHDSSSGRIFLDIEDHHGRGPSQMHRKMLDGRQARKFRDLLRP